MKGVVERKAHTNESVDASEKVVAATGGPSQFDIEVDADRLVPTPSTFPAAEAVQPAVATIRFASALKILL